MLTFHTLTVAVLLVYVTSLNNFINYTDVDNPGKACKIIINKLQTKIPELDTFGKLSLYYQSAPVVCNNLDLVISASQDILGSCPQTLLLDEESDEALHQKKGFFKPWANSIAAQASCANTTIANSTYLCLDLISQTNVLGENSTELLCNDCQRDYWSSVDLTAGLHPTFPLHPYTYIGKILNVCGADFFGEELKEKSLEIISNLSPKKKTPHPKFFPTFTKEKRDKNEVDNTNQNGFFGSIFS
ncbi:hypothetical protein HDU92_000266 [Lobulomyces angularis]|nr:hypothetical protein HDU92_000266 [Lobulomyces angularis]